MLSFDGEVDLLLLFLAEDIVFVGVVIGILYVLVGIIQVTIIVLLAATDLDVVSVRVEFAVILLMEKIDQVVVGMAGVVDHSSLSFVIDEHEHL